jgi:hypothetical protein
MQKLLTLVIAFFLTPGISGCLEPEDNRVIIEEPTPFDFAAPIPVTTFYHYGNSVSALNSTFEDFTENNVPVFTEGTYYSMGVTTFEPTLGVTTSGALFMTAWNQGQNGATAIVKCTGIREMINLSEYLCEDVGPATVPNSNDPYLYVDLWTDRIMKFDMHALAGMTVEYSDDDGNSWQTSAPTSGVYTPQDHQTIASTPIPPDYFGPPLQYDTVWVYCINTGAQGPIGSQCETSWNGGESWDGQVIGHPTSTQCAGLTGHLVGANDGHIYRGNPSCDGPAAFRSSDGGRTWTEHTINTETGTATHEIALATDEESNVHAFWIGENKLPYYSYSTDNANTWSEAIMVAPPGVTGTGFPTVAAGSAGRVAVGYIGQSGNGSWNGYMSIMTDAFNENPLITTVAVNAPEDPLDTTEDCGYRRCGGFGDFIDLVIDLDGRPWIALANNPADEVGIFGTISEGPSLRGDTLEMLLPILPGGSATL